MPLPKLYGDEDSSDSEGLELADGSRVGKKAADGAGGSGGNKANKKSAAVELEDQVVAAVPVQVAAAVPAQVVAVA